MGRLGHHEVGDSKRFHFSSLSTRTHARSRHQALAAMFLDTIIPFLQVKSMQIELRGPGTSRVANSRSGRMPNDRDIGTASER